MLNTNLPTAAQCGITSTMRLFPGSVNPARSQLPTGHGMAMPLSPSQLGATAGIRKQRTRHSTWYPTCHQCVLHFRGPTQVRTKRNLLKRIYSITRHPSARQRTYPFSNHRRWCDRSGHSLLQRSSSLPPPASHSSPTVPTRTSFRVHRSRSSMWITLTGPTSTAYPCRR